MSTSYLIITAVLPLKDFSLRLRCWFSFLSFWPMCSRSLPLPLAARSLSLSVAFSANAMRAKVSRKHGFLYVVETNRRITSVSISTASYVAFDEKSILNRCDTIRLVFSARRLIVVVALVFLFVRCSSMGNLTLSRRV
jgi:hypothetical protein